VSSNFLSHLSSRDQCKALVDFCSKHALHSDVGALKRHVDASDVPALLRSVLAADGVKSKLFQVASVAGESEFRKPSPPITRRNVAGYLVHSNGIFQSLLAIYQMALACAIIITVLTRSPNTEVISFFRLVCLLSKATAAYAELATLTVAALTSERAHGALKLRLMASLYSLTDAGAGTQRYELFVAMAEFAVHTAQAAAMATRVGHLDALLAAWRVTELDRVRRLYRAANRLLAAAGDGRAALAAQVQYLTTFVADHQGQADAVVDAADAARQAVVLADVFVARNVLALGAVQLLKGSKEAHRGTLYELLALLVDGSLADFEALAKRAAADLAALDIDADAVRDKMRLLTVAGVCAAALDATAAVAAGSDAAPLVTPTSVELAALARALGVSGDADAELLAEQWTMRAINAGLIRAKIDQLARRVTVSYALRRSFSRADWKVAQQHLGTWLRNIDVVITKLDEKRAIAAPAPPIAVGSSK
jgi:translation initiation factor 3 subunit M